MTSLSVRGLNLGLMFSFTAFIAAFTPAFPVMRTVHSGWSSRADGAGARRAYESGWVVVLDHLRAASARQAG